MIIKTCFFFKTNRAIFYQILYVSLKVHGDEFVDMMLVT